MATIEKRRSKDSTIRYRVKIRRRGAPSISETFRPVQVPQLLCHEFKLKFSLPKPRPIGLVLLQCRYIS
jgi:hypothetical protein